MTRAALLLAALAGILVLGVLACRDPTQVNGTSLFISTDVRGVPDTRQLRIIGREDTTTLFGPITLPEAADGGVYDGGLLAGMPTVRILLSDEWVGHVVSVHGETLDGETVTGRGDSAPVTVVKGTEEDVVLVIAPPGVDGGVCAGCDGCCLGGVCQARSLDHCGANGAACVGCDHATSSNCSSSGVCECGTNADCGSGAVCFTGACFCGPLTCKSGCCQNNRCVDGTTVAACGIGGNTCQVCPDKKMCDPKQGKCH